MVSHPNTPSTIVPLPSQALAPGESYPDAVVERAYELWAVTRNAAAAARMLREELHAELGPQVTTPSERQLRAWTHYHGWTARADEDWRRHQGRNLFELQAQAVAAVRLGVQNLLLAASGAFADNPQDGVIRLKAAELAIRLVERGVIPLSVQPPESIVDTSDLPRDEQEARARKMLVQRH
jgi:hypothetical protein